jgi:hypothetical protein
MERNYGQAERVWVMDCLASLGCGMVSEKNIAFLRERNARYLVGTPNGLHWVIEESEGLLRKRKRRLSIESRRLFCES